MTSKELHIASGYFAKIITIKEIRGLIVEFPKNIFLNVPEVKIVYELDDGKLNIYRNGSKSESIACPNYAQRYLVATDVTIELKLRAMDTSLSRAFDKDGISITSEDDKLGIIDLIIPSTDKEIRRLEFIFQNALNQFIEHEDEGLVPNTVVEGFLVVTDRYLKGVQ